MALQLADGARGVDAATRVELERIVAQAELREPRGGRVLAKHARLQHARECVRPELLRQQQVSFTNGADRWAT